MVRVYQERGHQLHSTLLCTACGQLQGCCASSVLLLLLLLLLPCPAVCHIEERDEN
jgi:hypothetical protein